MISWVSAVPVICSSPATAVVVRGDRKNRVRIASTNAASRHGLIDDDNFGLGCVVPFVPKGRGDPFQFLDLLLLVTDLSLRDRFCHAEMPAQFVDIGIVVAAAIIVVEKRRRRGAGTVPRGSYGGPRRCMLVLLLPLLHVLLVVRRRRR